MSADDVELKTELREIVDACARFNDRPVAKEPRAAKYLATAVRKHVRYAGLVELKRALGAIAPLIEAFDHEQRQAAPIKSIDAGDTVEQDAIYYRTVGVLAILEHIRGRGPMADLYCQAGVLASRRGDIERLPRLRVGNRRAWAKMIAELDADGCDWWGSPADLLPGGAIASELSQAARTNARKRREKCVAAFRSRYSQSPSAFLALSDAAMLEVREQRGQRRGEVLGVQAEKAKRRAAKIERMQLDPGDWVEALRAKIQERLKTILRKRP